MASKLIVSLGRATQELREGGPRLEVGKETARGLVLSARNRQVAPFVHRRCLEFGHRGAFYVERLAATSNLDVSVRLDDRSVQGAGSWLSLDAGRWMTLPSGVGAIRVLVHAQDGDGRPIQEQFELAWEVEGLTAERPAPAPAGGLTTYVVIRSGADAGAAAAALVHLSERQRQVMACYAEPILRPGLHLPSPTHRQVGERLGLTWRQVAKVVEHVGAKVWSARGVHPDSRKGLGQAVELASWLVHQGVLTADDLRVEQTGQIPVVRG